MSNRVRATEDGLARISASIGASTFHGITVQGHCMGIVARTWRLPSQAAGYPTAYDGALAVQRAGLMRAGTNPPVGAVPWWAHRNSNNRPGHVASIIRPGVCIGNVGSTIQEAPLSRFSNLRWLGWCWPQDVPGWGSVTTPEEPDMPLTNEEIDRIAARVWAHTVNTSMRTDGTTAPSPFPISTGQALVDARGQSINGTARAVWAWATRTLTGGGTGGTGPTAAQIADATADEFADRLRE